MLEKLQAIADRYDELEKQISDPAVIADQKEWQKLTRAHARLSETVTIYRQYRQAEKELADSRQLLAECGDEPEMRLMISQEIELLTGRLQELADRLRVLLLPKDPNDEKNVIIEIRAGAGGDEAGLFAGDLFRMYCRFADENNWRYEVLDCNATGIGGFKEIIFAINGDGAYSRLKYESGVHRVQRVPETEASGRIHTSTVTVAVLPEAEEVEVEINPGDLRIDTYCASGAGGQHVNKTESAVRITHIPTGIVVQCQDEKSQLKNRERAMRVLRAKLLEKAQSEQQADIAEARKSQVGTGDRSERIRTYNFPQGRVTDHRIGLTVHKLPAVLNGELDEIIGALSAHDQAQRLQQSVV
ncbi:MAG: peptide chain release factor 1 [Negativicutes bacterium]|nr:peptide chain release factor 1 [Negativicutes bacterium]